MNLKLGELIRERLKAKDINQVQLAELVSLTPPQISRIISGERGTSLDNLIAIADALQIERGHFLRVAANSLPSPDRDEWVEEMSHKLTLLSPAAREMAAKIINALAEGEVEPNNKPKTKTKSATR